MFEQGLQYELSSSKSWNIFKRRFRLLEPYSFYFQGLQYTVPAGYEWDGPTGIPILKWFGKGWIEPSLRHDWLYETHFSYPGMTREDVDDFFFDGLKQNGVKWLTVWMIDVFFDPLFEQYWKTETPADSKVTIPLVVAFFASVIPTVAFLVLLFMTKSYIFGALVALFAKVAALF